MSEADTPPASFVKSENEALACISSFSGPVIIDLDETLYLQNSTEDFINCIHPAIIAAPVYRILALLAPWKYFGGRKTRDVWRVQVAFWLFPWTILVWKKFCRTNGSKLFNDRLLAVIKDRKDCIIATLGFKSIVKLLLAEAGCGDIPLVACRATLRDRRVGKAALVAEQIEEAKLAEALVLTDSTDDLDILHKCKLPCFTKWGQARFLRAFRNFYLPGDYGYYIKHPGGAAFKRVAEDLFLWFLIAFVSTTPSIGLAAGIFFLFLSMWSVYEIGYYDNDYCAAAYESDPVLTPEFEAFEGASFTKKAWAAAVICGICALLALGPFNWLSVLIWACVLVGLRGLYYLYNRIDKNSRVWLYLPVHAFRSLSFAALVPISMIGALALSTHVIARWMEYFIYRFGRSKGFSEWPRIPVRVVRFFAFTLVVCALLLSGKNKFDVATIILLAVFALLSIKDLKGILPQIKRIN